MSYRLHRPVIDKTGLKGVWYIGFRYSDEYGTPLGMGVHLDPRQTDPGPSIFTAVEEQLGLKLSAGTGPVDMLVIDSVSRPTPN